MITQAVPVYKRDDNGILQIRYQLYVRINKQWLRIYPYAGAFRKDAADRIRARFRKLKEPDYDAYRI